MSVNVISLDPEDQRFNRGDEATMRSNEKSFKSVMPATSLRFWGAWTLIVAAALLRLIPHPPGFAPIVAIGLFGGATFERRWMAFLVPLAALFISDLALGFHAEMPAVYGSVFLIQILGLGWLRTRHGLGRVMATSAFGSILFFLITNASVWLTSGMYAHSLSGLFTSYVMGLPFLLNGAVGDMFYSLSLFGLWAIYNRTVLARSLSAS